MATAEDDLVVLWKARSPPHFCRLLTDPSGPESHLLCRVDHTAVDGVEAIQRQIRRINLLFAKASLGLSESTYDDRPPSRRVQRNFVMFPEQRPRLDLGGRLSGASWLTASQEKLKSITINGGSTTKLDYRCTHAAILYAKIGKEPPGGDLYDVAGLERHVVKRVLNDLLFGMSASSTAIVRIIEEYDPNLKTAGVVSSIEKKHPLLTPYFGSTIGPSLMFIATEIILQAVEAMHLRGIVGLPRHDSIILAERYVDPGRIEMMRAAQRILGLPLSVSVK